MKELIRHILWEETKDYRSGILDIIDNKGLFAGAKIVGGLNNLKKVFKDNIELINRINDQKGEVSIPFFRPIDDDDSPTNDFESKEPLLSITLPFYVVGIDKNRWNTNTWAEINVIYDESLLNDRENKLFKLFLTDSFVYDGTPKIINNATNEVKDHHYVTLKEINGVDINKIGFAEFPYEEIFDIMKKLENKTSINESSNSALNYLKRRINRDEIVKSINDSISFVNGFRDREEMEGDTFERIVLDATMDDFHSILSKGGSINFDYDGIHNGLHQLFHDYIMDKYVEYNNENDILMEEITSRRTGEEFNELPKRDQMNVKLLYNYLVANHMGIYEIKDSYVIALDNDGNNVAYLISKKNNQVTIDYNFNDKLMSLIKDKGYRDDLVEIATYIFLDKHLPKEIKFNKDKKMGGGHIALY
jgi:hypothetical protein